MLITIMHKNIKQNQVLQSNIRPITNLLNNYNVNKYCQLTLIINYVYISTRKEKQKLPKCRQVYSVMHMKNKTKGHIDE